MTSGDGFYCQMSGCDRAEGLDWPFARKDNLAIHMRNVHHPDKRQKPRRTIPNQDQKLMPDNASSSEFSTSPPTTGTAGYDDLFGDHISSPNTSNEAASTADAAFDDFEDDKAEYYNTHLDLSTFAPDGALYEDLEPSPVSGDWNSVEDCSLRADVGADTAAITSPTQAVLNRAVFDPVRNDFCVPLSPLFSRGVDVQEGAILCPVPPGDSPMLGDVHFGVFNDISQEFANDGLSGLFGDFSSMGEVDYQS